MSYTISKLVKKRPEHKHSLPGGFARWYRNMDLGTVITCDCGQKFVLSFASWNFDCVTYWAEYND